MITKTRSEYLADLKRRLGRKAGAGLIKEADMSLGIPVIPVTLEDGTTWRYVVGRGFQKDGDKKPTDDPGETVTAKFEALIPDGEKQPHAEQEKILQGVKGLQGIDWANVQSFTFWPHPARKTDGSTGREILVRGKDEPEAEAGSGQ